MSVPDLIGAYMFARDEVRVNLGSTCMSLAPFSIAAVTQWKEMGWFSAAFDPITSMTSALPMSVQ